VHKRRSAWLNWFLLTTAEDGQAEQDWPRPAAEHRWLLYGSSGCQATGAGATFRPCVYLRERDLVRTIDRADGEIW